MFGGSYHEEQVLNTPPRGGQCLEEAIMRSRS